MNKNDDKILILKEQIEKRKAKLEKAKRFQPVTTCSIAINDNETRKNINVLDKTQLIDLAVKINALDMSARELDYGADYQICGFAPIYWLQDIEARIDILSKKDQETTLKMLEKRLAEMLSEDKKLEMELAEIESLLKD